MLCLYFVKFGRREIGEIMHCSPDKKNKILPLALQPSLLRGSRPKSAKTIPDNVFRVLQVLSKSVGLQFWRSYNRTREHRQNAPWRESNIQLKRSFESNWVCSNIERMAAYRTGTYRRRKLHTHPWKRTHRVWLQIDGKAKQSKRRNAGTVWLCQSTSSVVQLE